MATAYHRDQPGAPALTYSSSLNSVAQFTALKTILKACLITGYGSRPAAGWLLINEGANFIVLRTGSLSGYVCLTWVLGGAIRIYLAETYTGMSGDVMTGDGLKSGTAASNAVPHAVPGYMIARADAATGWAVVADAATCVLSIATESSPSELLSAASGRGFTLYIGEDSEGGVVAVGGTLTTSASGIADSFFSGANSFTALKRPATGLLVAPGAITIDTPTAIHGNNKTDNSDRAWPSVTLAPCAWFGDGAYAGRLRGIALIPELAGAAYISACAKGLGRVGATTQRDIGAAIDLGDGSAYYPRHCSNSTPFFLLTDNSAFWL